VNETIERDYFRRMFATSKMATDDKSGHHNAHTKKLLKKLVRQILGLPEQESAPIALSGNEMLNTIKIDAKTGLEHLHPSVIQQRMLKTKEEEAMEADEGSDDEKPTPMPEEQVKMEVDVNTESISNTQRLGSQEIAHEVWRKLFNGKQKKKKRRNI
jgi:hypothetical protein